MLVFDQLKKDDAYLRWLAVLVLAGMLVLFCGLWWIQVVSTRHFQERLEVQSIRTVRLPAVRGKILDRNGQVLAENRPAYSIDLYLEDLSKNFQAACSAVNGRARTNLAQQKEEALRNLGHRPSRSEEKELNKKYAFTTAIKYGLENQTRYQVAYNIIADLGNRLQQPLQLQEKAFQRHYQNSLAIPMPILADVRRDQIASFEEQSMHMPGLDLEVKSVRQYPNGTLAAHVLGYLMRNMDSIEGEPAEYDYRLDDYAGKTGIEAMFDKELHGTAGGKSVLVNNWGYRQSETIWQRPEPGQNLVLTLDLEVQAAVEAALARAQSEVRGAVVVMDARNGDVIAMASAPTYDPNHFVRRYFEPDPAWNEELWMDPVLGRQKNKAMQENYQPGSTFKILVSLAALELGVLNPDEKFENLGYYALSANDRIGDVAGVGEFDFKRAFAKSSNSYFITQGLKPGVLQKLLALGQKLHLGEKTGLIRNQEVPGMIPSAKRISSGWYLGDTAYFSIGQGEINITPLQMAVMVSAVANGGTVYWPRLVARTDSPDGIGPSKQFVQGYVRDHLGVSKRSLDIVRRGMLEDIISPEGSGKEANIAGFQIAGKTGTAEVGRKGHLDKSKKETWFVAFGPYESPRYTVVAFVEGGNSGARTCVPVVRDIFKALIQRENKSAALAQRPGGNGQ